MRTALLALTLLASPAIASDFTHEEAIEAAKTMQDRETLLATAGKGELAPLHYAPVLDKAHSFALTQTLTMVQDAPPMPPQTVVFPATTYSFTSTVTKTPEGAPFTVETLLDDVSVDPDADPMIVNMMGPMLASMKGMTTTETVDAKGTTTNAASALPPGANPGARQQIDQIQSLVSRLLLPNEPVGVGAVWRHKIDQDAGGFDVSVITSYTLTERTDTTIALDMTIHQVIPSQPLNAPGLPAGASATITEAKGVGTGTMVVDLTTANTTELDMSFELVMNVNASMQANTMVTATSQNVKMTIAIEPAP